MYGNNGISKSQIFLIVISIGYLNHKYLYQGYSMDILFQSARGPYRGSTALRALWCFGPGSPRPSSHHPLPLAHCHALLPSLSHPQALQTRFAPPKLPQSLVDLIHVASLSARLVGCICQPMWKPGAPVLAELVLDGRSIVA